MPDNKELLGEIYQQMAQAHATEVIYSKRKRVRFDPKKALGVPLLDQLGREITGGEPPLLVPKSLPTLVLDTGGLTFDDSTPVDMNGNLTLFPNGQWSFFVHMHNSGGVGLDGQLVIGIVFHGIANPDPYLGIKISGHMGGIFGDRNFDTTTSGNHPPLVELMNQASDYDWQIEYGANVDLEALVSDTASTLGTVASFISLL